LALLPFIAPALVDAGAELFDAVLAAGRPLYEPWKSIIPYGRWEIDVELPEPFELMDPEEAT
jgi:hypothetical protein